MLIVDVSEDKRVINKLLEKVGKDGFKVDQIGCTDCKDKKFPIKPKLCMDADEMGILAESGISYDTRLCTDCNKRTYIRFADFTNITHSFYYERKTVLDFIGSRRRRLYEQLDKIDTFVSGRKGLILEGMSDFVPIYDAYWKSVNKKLLQKLSPLEQVVALGGKKEWTMSFIRELKMRDMEFVQTWNLDETIDFLIQCDEGYDKTPKLRVLPKRYPEIPLEQNILVLFNGIGKVRSEKILENPKISRDLKKLIKDVKELGYETHKN
jgi:ERCC4-type nuclease